MTVTRETKESMAKRMSAKEARDNFTDVLGMVYYGNESVIVEKKGRPFAVVISPREYERLQQVAKDQLFAIVDQVHRRNQNLPDDEVREAVTAEVEAVRTKLCGGAPAPRP